MNNEKSSQNKDQPKILINKTHWGWPVAVVVIGVLGVMFIAGLFAWASWGGYRPHGYHMGYSTGMMGGAGYQMMDWDGHWTNTSGQDRALGTVTDVSGDNFTVAGGGSTKKVQTSSSTRYVYGDQVKVNDTVLVLGNTSGGALRAERVVINP